MDDFVGPARRTVRIRGTVVETNTAKTGNGTRFMWKDYPKTKLWRSVGMTREAATAVQELIDARGLMSSAQSPTGEPDQIFSMPDLTPTKDAGKVEEYLNGERRDLGPPLLPLRTNAWREGLPPSRAYFRTVVWASGDQGGRSAGPDLPRPPRDVHLLAAGPERAAGADDREGGPFHDLDDGPVTTRPCRTSATVALTRSRPCG